MRDYQAEFEKRVTFIQSVLNQSKANGIVYGNSGGKDSALVGILCKAACDNTVGIILPCTSKRNYEEDTADAFKAVTPSSALSSAFFTGVRSTILVSMRYFSATLFASAVSSS